MTRRTARRSAAVKAGIPHWSSDIRPVRGKCLGRVKRKPCGSRWGVVRVSLDFRDPDRVDRLAVVECASCGRVWRRVKPPTIRSTAGYQTVRLDVIIPATMKRWFSRGHWHREGDDSEILRDADLGDVDEAARAHGVKADRRADAAARAKARKAEAEATAIRETRAMIARMDETRSLDEAREALAAARENA